MLSVKLSWIICFFNCFVFVDLTRPGVRSLLTLKGLNYVRKIAMPILSKKLNGLKIPTISGSADLFVGDLKYDFKKITVSQVKIPYSTISILNNTGLVVKGAQITFKINDLWSYALSSWPYLSDDGSCVISAKEISLNVILAVDKGNEGKPSVNASHCNLNIGDIDISFQGGASWLYNLFVLVVKDRLKDQLEKVICQVTVKAINKEVNAALRTIPDKKRVFNGTIQMNYELVNKPISHPNGLETDFKGEFWNVQHALKSPYIPEMLPPITGKHSKMLDIWITAYTVNTFLFSEQQTGLLHAMITQDDLPDDIPIKLNTYSFFTIVPQLYIEYPGRDMTIMFNITKPSLISFSPHQSYLTVIGTMAFNVILDGNRLVNCFTLNTIGKLKISSIFIDQRENSSYLCCRTSDLRIDISLLESQIGEFNLTPLKFITDILAQFVATRYITVATEKGLLLPVTQNTTLLSPECSMEKDHVLVSTDFQLHAQP